jgi:hypothetical protein
LAGALQLTLTVDRPHKRFEGDYATAITDLTLRQANLTASQKSFLAVQGLSLFNFI